jgi:hypothetical protein
MITRNNYEEYFLLYADDELSAAEKVAVEEFVNENPDLRAELIAFQQLKIKPESNIVFENKNLLFKQSNENSFININNYEEYFLLYADDELNDETKKVVEKFVHANPSLQQEFELLLSIKLLPDNNIVFPDKEILYKEKRRRVVLLPWMRIAAAAIVLLLVGLFVFNNVRKNSEQKIVTTNNNKNADQKVVTNNDNDNKKIKPVVTSSAIDSLHNTDASIKKLAVNKSVTKMRVEKNKNDNKKQNQQLNQDVAFQNIDSSEQIVTTKIDRSVQKINDLKVSEITAPSSLTSNTANLVAYTSTSKTDNNVDGENIDSEDKFYIANTSAKKSKFRGFFRQVSRAFAKTTHAGNDNNDAILIGSFRVALK